MLEYFFIAQSLNACHASVLSPLSFQSFPVSSSFLLRTFYMFFCFSANIPSFTCWDWQPPTESLILSSKSLFWICSDVLSLCRRSLIVAVVEILYLGVPLFTNWSMLNRGTCVSLQHSHRLKRRTWLSFGGRFAGFNVKTRFESHWWNYCTRTVCMFLMF